MNSVRFFGWVAAILLLAIFFRLYHLDFQSFWLDEIWTMFTLYPERPLADVIHTVATDTAPPLYYILLRGWFLLTGYGECQARLFSALLSILSLLLAGFWVRRTFGQAAMLLMLALLCTNWYHVYYAQEARNYTLLFLTALLAIWAFTAWYQNPQSPRAALALAFATSALIMTHYHGAFFALGLAVAGVWGLAHESRFRTRKALLFTGAAVASVVLVFLLWLPYLRLALAADRAAWLLKPTFIEVLRTLPDFFGREPIALLVVAAGMVMAVFARPQRHPFAIPFLLIGLVAFFTPVLISLTLKPVFHQRYVFPVLAPLLLLAVIGWKDRLTPRTLPVLLLLILAAGTVKLTLQRQLYTQPRKTQFTEVTTALAAEAGTQPAVVLTHLPQYYTYTLRKLGITHIPVMAPPRNPAFYSQLPSLVFVGCGHGRYGALTPFDQYLLNLRYRRVRVLTGYDVEVWCYRLR